jgi:hypothetical protein
MTMKLQTRMDLVLGVRVRVPRNRILDCVHAALELKSLAASGKWKQVKVE